ncbi:MAG TPA: hypothetical protein VFB08_07810 [Burkholderiales bacterium]|nr:hypothetical protein [Burkholderiales bacterium]
MVEAVLALTALSAIANLLLIRPFVFALREEAPEVFADFLAADSRGVRWRADARLRYWKLILFRDYRTRLAHCPRARAWASWLFLVNWIQLTTVLFYVVIVLARHAA